ncbi:hypothetical protein QNI16_23590 [Cytophagaceae bacterium YF14B1]|uniref:Excisionase n=1 Tax=Xanthocytophaga flava TaxID=3048013 RepID=A0AAE3QQ97_9BACT|nr:hypothetical protein [Xanthocytophaga flavus]MDJ1483502.1 hypothetical protein [Xanthocytophaga flavus]
MEKNSLEQKRVWRVKDFSSYTGWKESYVYKLLMQNLIPGVSKPNGKTVFIDSEKAILWLLSNPQKTQEEIDSEAATFVALR